MPLTLFEAAAQDPGSGRLTNLAVMTQRIALDAWRQVRAEALEEAAKRAPHQIAYNIRAPKPGQSGGG